MLRGEPTSKSSKAGDDEMFSMDDLMSDFIS
jgi:hypothetical protein